MTQRGPKRSPLTYLRRYAPPVLRVSALLCVLGLGLTAFLIHRVHAQVNDALMSLGPEMRLLAGSGNVDRPRALALNGEQIHFASGTTEKDLDTVLDWYEGNCRKEGGDLGAQLERALAEGKTSLGEGTATDHVLRDQEGSKGFVACLALGEDEVDAHELLERFERFQKSLNLADVGDMRYVFAEEGQESTHFVAFWSEGSLDIGRMFPREGDAPGRDVGGIPRPPGGRRILSTFERGEPAGMAMYGESHLGAAELERFYERELPARGWSIIDYDRKATDERMLVTERGSQMVTLVFKTDELGRGLTTILTTKR
jgi:hypothetical protein